MAKYTFGDAIIQNRQFKDQLAQAAERLAEQKRQFNKQNALAQEANNLSRQQIEEAIQAKENEALSRYTTNDFGLGLKGIQGSKLDEQLHTTGADDNAIYYSNADIDTMLKKTANDATLRTNNLLNQTRQFALDEKKRYENERQISNKLMSFLDTSDEAPTTTETVPMSFWDKFYYSLFVNRRRAAPDVKTTETITGISPRKEALNEFLSNNENFRIALKNPGLLGALFNGKSKEELIQDMLDRMQAEQEAAKKAAEAKSK